MSQGDERSGLTGPGQKPPPAPGDIPSARRASGSPSLIPKSDENPIRRGIRIHRELRALLRDALKERFSAIGSERSFHLNLSLKIQPFQGGEHGEESPEEREFSEGLLRAVRRAVDEEVSRASPFPPGRVRCFWCGSFECPHAAPSGPRSIFGGYGPTGLPLWPDLATLALERRDPRIDDLYREPPVPLVIQQTGRELVSARLPVYGKDSGIYRVLSQVTVGYLNLPVSQGAERAAVALTFQAVAVDRGRARVHLNVIGRLPDGTDLWRVLEEEPDSRLANALRAARARLMEIAFRRGHRRGDSAESQASAALGRLSRNLERIFRQQARRTKHAQTRHLDRERPAAAALQDAVDARPEEIFRDISQSTWVVLGPRSRVHFFNDRGQHITSVVFPGETVRRRTSQGKWRPAPHESVRSFQETVARLSRSPESGV